MHAPRIEVVLYMKTFLDCIPCFIRQTLEAARMATNDQHLHEQMLRDVLRLTSEMTLTNSPPLIGQHIHRRLRELTGNNDPYAAVKRHFNQMALDMLPELHAKVASAQDPFTAAVRLAIVGNIIDFGPKGDITEADALDAIAKAFSGKLHGDVNEFRKEIDQAKKIVYLADNAGEIVFDRILIEQILPKNIIFVVRGAPVINDATWEDAIQAGLTELVQVIDNGSDAPGTILGDCSTEFLHHFNEADLIIAKGQGNFETLSDVNANIFFLFKVKCPVIGEHVGLPMGLQVLLKRPVDILDV